MHSELSAQLGRSRLSRPATACAGGRGAARCRLIGRPCSAPIGATLIELLCVMAIIGILASLLLPAVSNAYVRVRGMAEEWEAPAVADMLRHESRNYCAAHPQYNFDSKTDFADKCALAPKCRDWVEASRTEFVPFNYLAPTNTIVLSVHIGRRHATLYAFPKGDLTVQPQR